LSTEHNAQALELFLAFLFLSAFVAFFGLQLFILFGVWKGKREKDQGHFIHVGFLTVVVFLYH
jgi:hypothetical protein